MALPVPNLDDRTFQDLVREARSMIPRYCPEWTDHNLSDPGITLIELFSWLVEVLLYRLNKVPAKNYIKFLDLIGVKLAPAAPATAEITFRLSAAQEAGVVIPSGTEVATVRTETEDAIVFTTDADLRISAPYLTEFLMTHDGVNFVPFLEELGKHKRMGLFKEVPEPGNAFYLGYSESLAGKMVSIHVECVPAKGVGIIPQNPPLAFEYWDGMEQDWQPFERRPEAVAWLEKDGTGAFNATGDLILHVPRSSADTEVGLRRAHWIRCRVTEPGPDQPGYQATPEVLGITSSAIGDTVTASHGFRVNSEVLGRSDGTSGQSFRLENSPILALARGEAVEVQHEDGSVDRWVEVGDFSQSSSDDKHFVCDTSEGEIRFGPGIRQPNGEISQHGRIPASGSLVRLSSYRHGGGSIGNVGKNTLTVLKTSIPYVASVMNRRAASGGSDPESVESAMLRGPQMFRTRNRAVTEADFEFLAMECSPSIARAKCVQPRDTSSADGPPPGVVLLLLVPAVSTTGGRIPPEQLDLTQELKQEAQSYLDERRLLTSLLVISEPTYYWVSVEAKVRMKAKSDPAQVRAEIEDELYGFINPLVGGQDGNGWPFGRALTVSDVYSRIQRVEGVEYVEEARIDTVDMASGQRDGAGQRLELPRMGVLCSHEHSITVTQE